MNACPSKLTGAKPSYQFHVKTLGGFSSTIVCCVLRQKVTPWSHQGVGSVNVLLETTAAVGVNGRGAAKGGLMPFCPLVVSTRLRFCPYWPWAVKPCKTPLKEIQQIHQHGSPAARHRMQGYWARGTAAFWVSSWEGLPSLTHYPERLRNMSKTLPTQHCMTCNELLGMATGIGCEGDPAPGDVTICWYCGAVMLFAEDLSVA